MCTLWKSFWFPGEPDNWTGGVGESSSKGEDCAQMDLTQPYNGQFLDSSCDLKKKIICESKAAVMD